MSFVKLLGIAKMILLPSREITSIDLIQVLKLTSVSSGFIRLRVLQRTFLLLVMQH